MGKVTLRRLLPEAGDVPICACCHNGVVGHYYLADIGSVDVFCSKGCLESFVSWMRRMYDPTFDYVIEGESSDDEV